MLLFLNISNDIHDTITSETASNALALMFT